MKWARILSIVDFCAAVPGWTAAQPAPAVQGVQVQGTVKASMQEVWQAFTASESAQTFLRTEGADRTHARWPYEIYFKPANGAQSTKGKWLLSYEPEAMLSFEWSAPPEVPAVRNANMWVVIRLNVGPERTQVHISHLGYGSGPEWDQARKHFEQGWAELLARLQQRFTEGPIDWASQPMTWKKRPASGGATG
jgi:uncharacterized protein YndB with AHSA1/START domain